ncbi:MAG: hypothetical protein QOG64_2724 [Acidimicrobiaceae bacterium]|nr:hypothetical protein [Acidimicrobiaceae bacterium]
MLALAKPALDVGLSTNQWDAMRAFYVDGLGLPYEELLPVGGGVRQHRLGLRGSVLKVNDNRDPLGDGPTGYTKLFVADPTVAELTTQTDPDGLEVVRVPAGTAGIEAVGVEVSVADPDAYEWFATEALGAEPFSQGSYRLATTTLVVRHVPTMPMAGAMRARGFRYLTIQVRDVVAEHARLLGLGVTEGMAPRRLGDVAMISFVRDPGGNWIEISQRASLTGPLAQATPG